MRTTETIIEKIVGDAQLGELVDINNSIEPVSLNRLVPYIAGTEDIEIILKNQDLVAGKPLEMNGYRTKQLLAKANKVELDSGRDETSYVSLVNNSPTLISFPSEVTWLAADEGVQKFKESIEWILQKDNIGFDHKKAVALSSYLGDSVERSYQKYSFWTDLANNCEGEHLFRLLINASIDLSLQAKAKFLSGILPVMNKKYPSSIGLSHNVNLGYGSIISDREDEGETVPGCLYTINLNTSMIGRNDFSDELKKIVSLSKEAMDYNWFDGIYLSVRDLERISGNDAQVATLSKLITELSHVAQDEHLPLWLSRFGLIGLPAFDMGASFASYTPNLALRDIFKNGGGGNSKNRVMHGKALNIDARRLWDANEINKLQSHKQSLPALASIRNTASSEELEPSKARAYRTRFSKPYNIASMNELSDKWNENVRKGEINPGKEYIKTFSSPSFYGTWGCE
ncbi:hypothetical protein [Methanococcoides sp. AM1]|uniref:hypothetical protein n=1 Tax=Methanococcoides sp. AM1 TaxID=1201011 RepID=UPI0010839D1A|nr:hypothetical protein [Methanococcoides sp. AM1]